MPEALLTPNGSQPYGASKAEFNGNNLRIYIPIETAHARNSQYRGEHIEIVVAMIN